MPRKSILQLTSPRRDPDKFQTIAQCRWSPSTDAIGVISCGHFGQIQDLPSFRPRWLLPSYTACFPLTQGLHKGWEAYTCHSLIRVLLPSSCVDCQRLFLQSSSSHDPPGFGALAVSCLSTAVSR